jgi:hypothetical protein
VARAEREPADGAVAFAEALRLVKLPPGLEFAAAGTCRQIVPTDPASTKAYSQAVRGAGFVQVYPYFYEWWWGTFGGTLASYIVHVRNFAQSDGRVILSGADLTGRTALSSRTLERIREFMCRPTVELARQLDVPLGEDRLSLPEIHAYLLAYVGELVTIKRQGDGRYRQYRHAPLINEMIHPHDPRFDGWRREWQEREAALGLSSERGQAPLDLESAPPSRESSPAPRRYPTKTSAEPAQPDTENGQIRATMADVSPAPDSDGAGDDGITEEERMAAEMDAENRAFAVRKRATTRHYGAHLPPVDSRADTNGATESTDPTSARISAENGAEKGEMRAIVARISGASRACESSRGGLEEERESPPPPYPPPQTEPGADAKAGEDEEDFFATLLALGAPEHRVCEWRDSPNKRALYLAVLWWRDYWPIYLPWSEADGHDIGTPREYLYTCIGKAIRENDDSAPGCVRKELRRRRHAAQQEIRAVQKQQRSSSAPPEHHPDSADLWRRALDEAERRLGNEAVEGWLKDCAAGVLADDTLSLGTRNRTAREWIAKKLAPALEAILTDLRGGRPTRVRVTLSSPETSP